MNVENLRITKLKEYLLGIVNSIASDSSNDINANFLSNDIDNYSIDKVPTDTKVEKWVL